MSSGMSVACAMSDPAAVAADPERFASMLEQMRDEPVTPEGHRRLVAQLHDWAAKATSAPPTPRRILAGDAQALSRPRSCSARSSRRMRGVMAGSAVSP